MSWPEPWMGCCPVGNAINQQLWSNLLFNKSIEKTMMSTLKKSKHNWLFEENKREVHQHIQGLLATHSGLCTASTDMLVIKGFGEYLIDYFCPCDTHEYHGILNHERVCFKNAYSSSSASRAAMHANVELVKYKKKEGLYFFQAESKTFWWWSCSKILPKY